MNTDLKRKAAMVLHQIEESLGGFVLSKGNIESLNIEKLDSIHKREVDKGRFFNKNSIKDIVEATYLEELFGFALDITREDSLNNSVNYLYSLFHHLDIYEVRNAVSHPNRPFWDCYWYRVAAIASDPVNEILGLSEVKQALISAEEGIISDPPEEWLQKIIWQIPNNLPKQFDHGLTGLIGRSKELQELKKHVNNPRINTIALVAPGGAGKTALALDLLDTIVSTPSFSKIIDGVIFITMKTEKLTSEGVVLLDSIQTMEELKANIFDSINEIYNENYESFEAAINGKSEDRILLCVDNLETILRDRPGSFDELNYELPRDWRVLVTSRVTISHSTIVNVESLKENSAVHLARTYLSKRGGAPLAESEYQSVTKNCYYNPLAIRLTLDLLLMGHDIPQSINVANKEIAEFSYNNLIDALSPNAVEILEAIFVEDKSTRLSLCEILEKSLDDVSSAIGELTRTSLIARRSSDQGELYSLSDSIRDLLVISPRNIKIRHLVQDRINNIRVLSKQIDFQQDERGIPSWRADYIPKAIPENLKILVTSVNAELGRARKNTDIAVMLFKKLKDAKFIYENDCLYHRSFGRVLEILKDFKSAEEHYKQAIAISVNDAASYYLLARLYYSSKKYDEAVSTYLKLIDMGWVDREDAIDFGKTIYNGFFLSLLYDGKYEQILEFTKKWKDSKWYRGVWGTYRASAWKRKMENIVDSDPKGAVDALTSAARILDDVFKTEGYFSAANKQAVKVFEEVEFCFSRREFQNQYPDSGRQLLSFVAKNIINVSQSDNGMNLDDLVGKLSRIDLDGNPFKDSAWRPLMVSQDIYIDDNESELQGLVAVKVCNRPTGKASFLFARDAFDTDYFLHFNNFKNGDWKSWCQLSLGASLDIVIDLESNVPGKALNAKEIYMK